MLIILLIIIMLSNDIFRYIFTHLLPYQLPKLLGVCKSFNNIVRSMIGYNWYVHSYSPLMINNKTYDNKVFIITYDMDGDNDEKSFCDYVRNNTLDDFLIMNNNCYDMFMENKINYEYDKKRLLDKFINFGCPAYMLEMNFDNLSNISKMSKKIDYIIKKYVSSSRITDVARHCHNIVGGFIGVQKHKSNDLCIYGYITCNEFRSISELTCFVEKIRNVLTTKNIHSYHYIVVCVNLGMKFKISKLYPTQITYLNVGRLSKFTNNIKIALKKISCYFHPNTFVEHKNITWKFAHINMRGEHIMFNDMKLYDTLDETIEHIINPLVNDYGIYKWNSLRIRNITINKLRDLSKMFPSTQIIVDEVTETIDNIRVPDDIIDQNKTINERTISLNNVLIKKDIQIDYCRENKECKYKLMNFYKINNHHHRLFDDEIKIFINDIKNGSIILPLSIMITFRNQQENRFLLKLWFININDKILQYTNTIKKCKYRACDPSLCSHEITNETIRHMDTIFISDEELQFIIHSTVFIDTDIYV